VIISDLGYLGVLSNLIYRAKPRMRSAIPPMIKKSVGHIVPALGTVGITDGVGDGLAGEATSHVQSLSV